jgi:hypothetical protein
MNPKKKTFFIFLTSVLIVGALLSFAAFMYYSRVASTHMGNDLVQKAESALGEGIIINDRAQDFPLMGQKGEDVKEKQNNNNPYNYSFLDLKEVKVGVDEDNIYIKVIFYGDIPKDAPRPNGDKILSDGIKINFVNEKGVEQVDFAMSYDFIPFGIKISNCYYSSQPTGIVWPEDARFAKTAWDCKVFVGEDYILGALPIKDHAILKNKEIYFDVQHEAESKIYDHAAVDLLGGEGKMPAVIKWTKGTKDFEKYDQFYTN